VAGSPYKTAWTRKDALAELRRERSRQFDPQVVDALLALEPEPSTPPTSSISPAGSHLAADGRGQTRQTKYFAEQSPPVA